MYKLTLSDEFLAFLACEFFALAVVFLWLLFKYLGKRDVSRPRRIAFIIRGRLVKKHMSLKVSQKVQAAVIAVDAKGNPAGSFDAPPAWSVSDAALASVVAAEDGLSAMVVPVGPVGQVLLQVSAVAAGRELAGSLALDLVAGSPVSLSIGLGEPQDQ